MALSRKIFGVPPATVRVKRISAVSVAGPQIPSTLTPADF